jgi:phosphoglycerate dehydrogenase-like enzyme
MRSAELPLAAHRGAPTVLAMSADVGAKLFPLDRLERFAVDAPELELLQTSPLTSFDSDHARRLFASTEVLITGWGCPPIDDAVLDRAPHLRVIAHAGGSVKQHVDPAAWERGILVTTATAMNAEPVAEFTLAMILLAGKRTFELSQEFTESRRDVVADDRFPQMRNYGKRIGLVGASTIGRRVVELLRPFAFEVMVADPFLSDHDAARLGVIRSDLDELLASSDVISLHAPALPDTHHLLDRTRIESLRPGTTLINTARGWLIDHEALARRVERGDLYAILDVTEPDVLPAEHPFYSAPNVFLTPHIAGSLGTELARLADTAVDEARRAARGEELRFEIRGYDLARIA